LSEGAAQLQNLEARAPRPNKHQQRSERTRLAILDAAEPLFAPYGLASVSMRQIALAAGVDLTLVTYHFHTKAALYDAVIERIMSDLTARRAALMDELARNTPEPTAVELFETLITAWFEIRFGRAPYRARLIVYGMEHDPQADGVRAEYGPAREQARRFLAALARAEPSCSPAYLHATYHCFSGALVYFMLGAHRIQQVSSGAFDVNSPEAIRQVLLQQVRNAFPKGEP
jgi:AcrR family transcriptional regulator